MNTEHIEKISSTIRSLDIDQSEKDLLIAIISSSQSIPEPVNKLNESYLNLTQTNSSAQTFAEKSMYDLSDTLQKLAGSSKIISWFITLPKSMKIMVIVAISVLLSSVLSINGYELYKIKYGTLEPSKQPEGESVDVSKFSNWSECRDKMILRECPQVYDICDKAEKERKWYHSIPGLNPNE